jgi:formamidopyrimidine-DNA glycosylase
MPELPEVEMYARYFERHALGQTIARVRVLDARICGTRKLNQLVGRSFHGVRRHGKHLFAEVSALVRSREDGEGSPASSKGVPRSARDQDLWLHIHFGMSGDLAYYHDRPPRFTRLVFDFDNGTHLAYEDMRLFGIVDLTPSPEDYIREHRLGPDPLDPHFKLRAFRALLHKRRGRVKALLLSQNVIAGIGNLYADEALFRSSIDPRRAVDRLTGEEVKKLLTSIRGVLQDAIASRSSGDDYPRRFLIQVREEGERCPRCGGTIRRTIVAGRTTYYCAKHQR